MHIPSACNAEMPRHGVMPRHFKAIGDYKLVGVTYYRIFLRFVNYKN
jgi:hypothetical protein